MFWPCKFAGNNFFSLKYIDKEIELKTTIMEKEVVVIIGNSGHHIDLSKIYTDCKVKKDIKCFFETLIKSIINANNKMIKLNKSV